jgi:hypothetical protein
MRKRMKKKKSVKKMNQKNENMRLMQYMTMVQVCIQMNGYNFSIYPGLINIIPGEVHLGVKLHLLSKNHE